MLVDRLSLMHLGQVEPPIYSVGLIGDLQIHSPAYQEGVGRSPQVHRFAPGRRPEATILGTPALAEKIILEGIKGAQNFQGMIYMGDMADVAAVEEMDAVFRLYHRWTEENPLLRSLIFLIGNHDVVHEGSFREGNQMGGVLGIALNLQGKRRSYENDIFLPEVGFEANKLDKEKFINGIYHHVLGQKPSPIILKDYGGSGYEIEGGREGRWKDISEAFNDFWKGSDIWRTHIQYNFSDPDLHPEQKNLLITARKLVQLTTQRGDVPIYIIGLDTMDYLDDSTSDGALKGHVSDLQVHLIQLFIEEMKRKSPNAKFILTGHFAVRDITDIQECHLNEVLSDEAVIAYLGAHSHKRNYYDLGREINIAEKLGIVRSSPLPEITIPAVVDFPHEMALMTYGLSPTKPDEIFFEVEFKGAEESENIDSRVRKSFEAVRQELNPYAEALVFSRDKRLSVIGLPTKDMPLLRAIHALGNMDTGLVVDKDSIPDQVIARSVIPASVVGHRTSLLLIAQVVSLSLQELQSDPNVGSALTDHYSQIINHHFQYYKYTLDTNPTTAWNPETIIGHLDSLTPDLQKKSDQILDMLKGLTSLPLNVHEKKLLHFLIDAIPNFANAIESYKRWIYDYQLNLSSKRPVSEMANQANLKSDPYFRRLLKKIWHELPSQSLARSFLALAHAESTEQENRFFGGTRDARLRRELATANELFEIFAFKLEEDIGDQRIIPDRIRWTITSDGKFGEIPPIPKSRTPDEQAEYLRSRWSDQGLYLSDAYRTLRSELSRRPENHVEDHWLIKGRIYAGSGTGLTPSPTGDKKIISGPNWGLALEGGARWHLRNHPEHNRISTGLSLGLDLGWQSRTYDLENGENHTRYDLNIGLVGKNSWTYGDPLGILEIGPAFWGGLSFRHLWDDADETQLAPTIGVGGQLALFEGSLALEGGRHWYFENLKTSTMWQFGLSIDFLSLMTKGLRVFGLRIDLFDPTL